MRRFLIYCLVLSASLVLSSCATSSGPTNAVEAYYTALVEGDGASLTQLSCADWEQQSKLLLDSFTGVKARLADMTCSELENDGSRSSVNCTGKIIATYGTEDQEIDLSTTTFILEKQGDAWLVCGQQ